MTQENIDHATPELLPNRAGFIGTMEQFLNALGVIASRKGTDGVIAAVALDVLDRRADLAAPSAPAEVEGLVERANKLATWCEGAGERDASEAASTLRELGEALTAQQAENERLRYERDRNQASRQYHIKLRKEADARADKAEAERDEWQWRDMQSAPRDGKHMVLAIQTPGGFVRNIEGAFMDGRWMNALNLDVEPLCWFPKTLTPDRFLPWTEEFAAYAKLKGDV